MADCLIAFGANEGDLQASFRQSVVALGAIPGVTSAVASAPLMTKPVGGPVDQPSYLNAVIRVTTDLQPADLHQRLIEIETNLGRERRVRWGARKIDLDLLLFDQQTIETDKLQVPHPRMSFRRFVLEPGAEVASEMVHVTSGKTIAQLLEHLNARPNVIAWVNPDAKLLQTLAVDDAMAGWTLVPVTTTDELTSFGAMAKLVVVSNEVVVTDGDGVRELTTAALNFPGPTLDLSYVTDPVAEVRAAAAACG